MNLTQIYKKNKTIVYIVAAIVILLLLSKCEAPVAVPVNASATGGSGASAGGASGGAAGGGAPAAAPAGGAAPLIQPSGGCSWWDMLCWLNPDLSEEAAAEPAAGTCTDTDASHANFITKKGTCDDGGASLRTDYCKSDTLTIDFYCGANMKCTAQTIDCAEYDQICVDGACVNAPFIFVPIPSPATCTETDRGNDLGTYGTCNDGGAVIRKDTCGNMGVLTEYYCDVNKKCVPNIVGCPGRNEQCLNGACVAKCEDSDDGAMFSIAGACKDYTNDGNWYSDTCSGAGTLTEYYCGGGTTCTPVTKRCSDLGPTFICSGGRCVP